MRSPRLAEVTVPLYNQEILRLAASVPADLRLTAPGGTSERRSPICGSRVTVDVALAPEGQVSEIGMVVRACALGQASAALLNERVMGRTVSELVMARDALAAWLAGTGPQPDWPGIAALTPAIPHSARHPSIRLAFEAAAEAAQRAANPQADAA